MGSLIIYDYYIYIYIYIIINQQGSPLGTPAPLRTRRHAPVAGAEAESPAPTVRPGPARPGRAAGITGGI